MTPDRSTPRMASGATSSSPAAVSVPTMDQENSDRSPAPAISPLRCSAEAAELGSFMTHEGVLQEGRPPGGFCSPFDLESTRHARKRCRHRLPGRGEAK